MRSLILIPLGVALAASGGGLPAQTLERGAELLRSTDAFDRQRGEVELRSLGVDSLPALARMAESEDRMFRFRAGRVFSDLLESLLADLDSEHQALVLDRNELKGFQNLKEAAKLREELKSSLEEWKKQDPSLEKKVLDLHLLEELEELEKRAAAGEGSPLRPEAAGELERLRGLLEEWKRSEAGFEERVRPLLRLARLEAAGVEGRALSELEEIRKKELEERIAEREPKVEALVGKLEAIGPAAICGMLARRLAVKAQVGAFYGQLVAKAVERFRADLLPKEPSEFEAKRYGRSLIWAREVDTNGALAADASGTLERHITATLRDLDDLELLVRERAADELYILGDRGRAALEAAMEKGSGAEAGSHRFLLGLLRWRIRPRVHARVGMDFHDYPELAFRDRRRKVFAYAHAAGDDSIPTLRAIVTEDALESSFFVKLAAAKALAGLRDMSGFNFLLIKHPDMTLKKPEVSRELLIIQGFEHIRDNDYQKAVEELRKLLDEYPFDFRGNYHIAFAYLLLKNYAKSIHHFEIARRINPQDQLTLYNLACAYALSGKKTEAVEALERSVEAGFDDYEHVEKDPDLESLRDDARYNRLVERMKTGR